MNIHKPIAALLAVAALASCDYEKNAVQDITGTLPTAAIRFFNFGINAPAVNFYADGTKLTAISSSACSTVPPSDTSTRLTESLEKGASVSWTFRVPVPGPVESEQAGSTRASMRVNTP